MTKKVALVILDGWGVSSNSSISASANAKTPFLDSLEGTTPYTELMASEEAVGLPKGQVGNSEVGHSTLGTGRVNYQNLVRINKQFILPLNGFSDKFSEHMPMYREIKSIFTYAKENNVSIHLVGLVSDGGVHSHINHLRYLLSVFHSEKENMYWYDEDGMDSCPDIFLHAITDGRDTDTMQGYGFLHEIKSWGYLNGSFQIADIIGRYYAMDRDNRWERIKVAYDLYVHGYGVERKKFDSVLEAMKYENYEYDITDEFIRPMRLLSDTYGTMQSGDVVINFNFRSDRMRELVSALTQKEYPEYTMKPIQDLKFFCMTEYDSNFKNLEVLFPPISLEQSLGEVLSRNGKTQLRIAETEKYPHVSFFFNGGKETPYEGEERILIPSPKVATYDLQPEMSAREITDACISYVCEHQPDFICLNYANPDMVGHTGVFDAAVKACETVDNCLARLIPYLTEQGYSSLIIADHGNADVMINEDGSPNTAHSLALVPCYLVNASGKTLQPGGSLADIAPTILDIMEIQQPKEMTGVSLLS